MPHTVLVVDPDSVALAKTARALSDAGFLVSTCGSFETVHPRLQFVAPELLVTCVRLGSYNGIQLVIRGRADHPNMKAIVIDSVFDSVLDRDARAEGAVYLERPANAEALVPLAQDLMDARPARVATTVPRRWPRKEITRHIVGTLGQSPVRIMDLSYGGVRLEVAGGSDAALMQGGMEFFVPDAGVSLRTTAVWAFRPKSGASWWCGLEVDETDAPPLTAWRAFVDSVR